MKNLTLFLFALTFVAIASCKKTGSSDTEETVDTVATEGPKYSLTLKWETDTVLTTCESVIYDSQNDVLYVSNIEGKPEEKDGKGSISQVTLEGEVTNRDWISGLNAPKGMAIHNGKLYVSDIDQIVEIDIQAGKISKKYPVQNATFLNDVAVTDQGTILVSDSRGGNIVQLENGIVSVYMENVASPNGLFVESGKLLTAHWDDKKVRSVDMETKEVKEFAEGLSNPDGIEAVGDGGYLVSNWEGEVTYVSADGENEVLLDTREQKLSAADIEYIVSKNLLLVPTFFGNKVMAYELVKN